MLSEDADTPSADVALRRVRLPNRKHGLGLRSRVALACPAYCGTFVDAARRFLDSDDAAGFFPSLQFTFGAEAFNRGIVQPRWLAGWIEAGSPEALAFTDAWAYMQSSAARHAVPGPLSRAAAVAGLAVEGRLQTLLTRQLEQVEFLALDAFVTQLPPDCEARRAWLEAHAGSQAAFGSYPSEDAAIGDGFADCLCHYLGLRLPSIVGAGVEGRRIPDRMGVHRWCDAYGNALTAANLRGGSRDDWHDAVLAAVYRDCPGGAQLEPDGVFEHVLPQDLDRQQRKGITFDLLARTKMGQRDGRRPNARPARVPFDLKTLSGDTDFYREGPAARSAERGAPVQKRADQVDGDYKRHARELDRQHHTMPDGRPFPSTREQVRLGLKGPVLTALETFPPVQGLVVGHRCGWSKALQSLAGEAADALAERDYRLRGLSTAAEARSVYVSLINRRWSGACWRAWSRCVAARVPCVGQADDTCLLPGGDGGGGAAAAAAPMPAWSEGLPFVDANAFLDDLLS